MAKKIKQIENPMVIKDEHGATLGTYSPDMLNAIKGTVAKDATDAELYMFLQIASMYDLNPFMKEIWFTKMNGEIAIMTSRDGYAKIAKRDPKFKKCQSAAVHEDDTFEIKTKMGEVVDIVHEFSHKDRGKLVGAYAVLTYNEYDHLYCYVDFKEYDKRNKVWKNYPSAMIRKVVENDVYKRFAGINGLSTFEDMPSKIQDESLDVIDIKEIKEVESDGE